MAIPVKTYKYQSSTIIETDAWQWPPKPGAKMSPAQGARYKIMHTPAQPYQSSMALFSQISGMAQDMTMNSNIVPAKAIVGVRAITNACLHEIYNPRNVHQPILHSPQGKQVLKLMTAVGELEVEFSSGTFADDIVLMAEGLSNIDIRVSGGDYLPPGFGVKRTWDYAGVFANEEGARIEVKVDPVTNMVAWRPASKPEEIWSFMGMPELMAWGFAPATARK